MLPEFLSYSYYPFPEPLRLHQPFPTLVETHEYLRNFAASFLDNSAIRLNTEVIAIEELGGHAGWKVILKDWADGSIAEEIWDGVVVANGWSDNPVWPQTEGLKELVELGLASHAKSYRGPEKYAGKVRYVAHYFYFIISLTYAFSDQRCLVIGNANSANDIAAHLAPVASFPVYQSVRRPNFPGFPALDDERIVKVAPVAKYLVNASSPPKIDVHLTDGIILNDIDVVLLGTGYKPYPDFIHVLDTSSEAGDQKLTPLVSSSTTPPRIPSLHRHILYAHNPSLAFINAPMTFTPFTLADVSSTWLTLAWTRKLPYPDTVQGRLAFEVERIRVIAERKAQSGDNPTAFLTYMVLGPDEQEYAQGLKDDVVAVRGDLKDVLPEWSDDKVKLREAMQSVKLEALRVHRDDPGLLI